ncbi:CLUMA_CG020647, isoform A [Clunio marinus]|uniref:CLUMA_CG020647, isoform A n=1 Tax=Clunio marinus TaxID=568069 RepID=A0A1J1J6T2_9DIPT|nr:CLUMA_CG020647, isoform A [Clunio marinus]
MTSNYYVENIKESASDVSDIQKHSLRPQRERKQKINLINDIVDQTICKRKIKRYHCIKCHRRKSFTSQTQLDRHIANTHSKKINHGVIICEICSAVLKSEAFYKRHLITKHPQTPKIYICDYDGKQFNAKDYLRIHMDRHRKNQILTCDICTKSYISLHTFRRHLKMHIEKHICSACGMMFSTKILLQNHFATKHTLDLPFKCNHCTRMFPTKTARNNHHYQIHKSKELHFKCNLCNVFFEMKEELRIHSFIHFDGEIKTCHECDQIFKNNRLLKIHMQKHQSEKSFQCETCGDYFTFKTGLAKHIRMNRCKGPKLKAESDETKELDQVDIAEIAKNQLNQVTAPSRKYPQKEDTIDLLKDIKSGKEESESETEDLFGKFFDDVKDENEIENEPNEKSLKTRWIRKRKSPQSIKLRNGRPHLIYICDFCGEKVKFKKEILKHMKLHSIFQKYKCKECPEAFKSRRKLFEHSIDIHEVKPQVLVEAYTCELCNRKFDIKSKYETHKLSHDDNARKYICSICNAGFKSVGNLRRHEAIHALTKDFHCSKCSKSFKTILSLKIHNESKHGVVKIYVNCPFCKIILAEKNLKQHIKNMHTEEGQEKPFSCFICMKTFKTEKLGQRHYESVHEPKNQGIAYLCSECPELQFYRQRDLKMHSFMHYNGTIYQCDICMKMFKSKRLLTLHQSTHKEEVKYSCKECNLEYKTRSGLRKHVVKLHENINKEKDFILS